MYRGKRALDITGSILMLIVLFVPLLVVTLISCLTQGFPVFLKQERYGKDGKVFRIYKFRTMRNGTPNMASNVVSEKQITLWGRILRKTSVDELPQILNVLKGDMSFVGPRPLIVEEQDAHKIRLKNNIYAIRPGITGWAQVNGRDYVGLRKKTELDKFYIDNASFLFDLKIFWKSIASVFSQKDIKH